MIKKTYDKLKSNGVVVSTFISLIASFIIFSVFDFITNQTFSLFSALNASAWGGVGAWITSRYYEGRDAGRIETNR